MKKEPQKSEPSAANTADPDRGESAVRARLDAIRDARRSRVRWTLSRHTAERAIVAIEEAQPRACYRRSGKSRRCKHHKRLL